MGTRNVRIPAVVSWCIRCVVFCLLLISCSACKERKEQKYVIGISQCTLDDAWRQAMINDVRIEALNYDHIELMIKGAENNNELQKQQIRELIRAKVDVLIVSPYQSNSLTEVIEEAYRSGIPVIVADRKVNTRLYTTFVGADNYEIGRIAGAYAATRLPHGATVLEIEGDHKTSPAQERHNGFMDALADRTDVHFIHTEGYWLPDSIEPALSRLYLQQIPDLVFSHNDMMAIAARRFFEKIHPQKGHLLPILGVDAVPGAGLEAVKDGIISASFLYPTGGEQVIRAAIRLLKGEKVEKNIPLSTALVDQSVAKTLLLQTDQLHNYKSRIETQKNRIDNLSDRFSFLEDSMSIILSLLGGLVLLVMYILYMNRKVRRSNRYLREINDKLEEQRTKLIELNAEIKEVTAQKLQFFTNISHEVRTPLTLIIAPLESLMRQVKEERYRYELELVQRNAQRLLRVINQLLDFRKVENRQEELKLRKVDIVAFIQEIKMYFDGMAAEHQITYRLETSMNTGILRIDTDLMEKVFVNLLSNSFKFTPDHGSVTIRLSETEEEVEIAVEDNGKGITPQQKQFIFDRFFTGNRTEGTGIGLYLVHEYVQMHKGSIRVESVPNVRTVFAVTLRKGDLHWNETDESSSEVIPYVNPGEEEANEFLSQQYDYRVLVVEDDREVNEYLCRELEENFRVVSSFNGKEALEQLKKQEIQLIVSDVMMPEMNGFELCKAVKTESDFVNVPIILLTALTENRQRIYGVTSGADLYIRKPFDMNYLKICIIRMLHERQAYQEALVRKLSEQKLLLVTPGNIEPAQDVFLQKFIGHLEAVYADAEYNVEKISSAMYVSRAQLHRKVKELTGKTPVDFLRSYRLNKALVLIREQRLTMSEIAYQTGFSSPAYFTKCFKDEYGMTPTQYGEKEIIK